ncbi:penicillin-binding transpeptidase domain-containing protein [Virgibacillus ainsalahensis]
MKKIALSLSIILFIFLAACSEEQIEPDERFDTFIEQWKNEEFANMYDMLSTEAKETYPTEEMVDRYTKIYEDLDVSDLNITYEELTEEELESAMDEGTATFPLHVEMETIAGPITFDYDATLIQEGEEDDEEGINWYVQWDPGFIFPELRDGGEISFQTEAPTRGEIYDRNQMPLALNGNVYEIGIIPEQMGDSPDQTTDELADILNMSSDAVDSAINASWVQPEHFVPIKKITEEKRNELSGLWDIPGVTEREVTGRIYPSGEAAMHLVGYLKQVTEEDLENLDSSQYDANDLIGARGLEQLYEEELKGQEGIKIVVTNQEEEVVLAEQPVENGETITLTIDINVQEKVYEAYDGDAGTATIMDPKSGETLALVSSPSFDPNEAMYGTTANFWGDLQDDEQQPTLNRFAATYAPGSVIKPVTSAIGLQDGTIDPNEGIEINGLTWSNGEGWGDYEVRRVSESDGPVDLKDALVRSDNIYFAMQALEIGSEAFISGLEDFGFSEELPYEYPIQKSTISADGTIEDDVMLANTSYGQGQIEMSALHLAATYTPLLNEGNMIKPTLLTSEETGQIWQEDLITADQANLIQDALRTVVTDGTATQAQEADFPISGKTGTAELKLSADDEDSGINSWFVAYPTEDQDMMLSMMMEQTQDKESGYLVQTATDLLNELK